MCMPMLHIYVHVGTLCVYVHRRVHVSSRGMATGEHCSTMLLFISASQVQKPHSPCSGHGWAMDTGLRLSTRFLKWTEELALGREELRVGAGRGEPCGVSAPLQQDCRLMVL